jgi:hypothetical protein
MKDRQYNVNVTVRTFRISGTYLHAYWKPQLQNNTMLLPSDRKSDQINYLDADNSTRHLIVSYTMAEAHQ